MTPGTLHEIVENEKRNRVGQTEHQRELENARAALTALENRLAAQDPEYRKKRELLVPILKPILRHFPPARWVNVFEDAYMKLVLPRDGRDMRRAEMPPPASATASTTEGELQFASDEAQELYRLMESPARALVHWREIIDRISSLFGKADAAAQRDSLLQIFNLTMGTVDSQLAKNQPELLENFRNSHRQHLKSFWIQECLIGENVDGRTLVALSRREIARGRMAADCTPIVPVVPPISPTSEGELESLNAEIDRQRKEAGLGRIPQRGIKTVLLYRVPGIPEQVGVSKVDPPVDGGAFFLDFSRPVQITRSLLGRRNNQIGAATELLVPILHQGQNASGTNRYSIIVHSSDPRFAEIRTLWKKRYPSAMKPPTAAASGIKLIVDFCIQFPDGR